MFPWDVKWSILFDMKTPNISWHFNDQTVLEWVAVEESSHLIS